VKILRKVSIIFDKTLDVLAVFAAGLIIIITLLVATEIVSRSFFNWPILAVVEVSEYSLLFITLLGAAWLLKKDGHVKLELLLNWISPRFQIHVNTFTSILGAIACLMVSWYTAQLTWQSYQIGSYFSTVLQAPKYPVLAVIPAGFFLIFIQFMRRTYGYMVKIRVSPGSAQEL